MEKLSIPPLKPDQWPSGDRMLWLGSLAPAGPFDDRGLASSWRPATIRGVEKGYGVYLGWLTMRGLMETSAMPTDRVDRERIRLFFKEYSPGRSEHTVATTIRGIAYYLRAALPPDGLPWLTSLAHRLSNNAEASRAKPPRMAHPQELIALGNRLMDEGAGLIGEGYRYGAPIFRDGLIIVSLITRPLRLRNIAALRIGISFVNDADGYRVHFAKEETKKGIAIDFHYPNWLSPSFDRYLGEVRPLLLKDNEQQEALWIGRRGQPLRDTMITIRIGNLTEQYLDRRISPHLFRDIAATTVAIHDPAHIGVSKSLLGHATLKSSQIFYNQASSFSAVQTYADVLARLRNGDDDGSS